MSALNFVIRILSGAVGGNLTGELFRNINLEFGGNSLVGGMGGLIGGYLAQKLVGGAVHAEFVLVNVFVSLLAGMLGGSLGAALVGWLKRANRFET